MDGSGRGGPPVPVPSPEPLHAEGRPRDDGEHGRGGQQAATRLGSGRAPHALGPHSSITPRWRRPVAC